MQNDPKGLLPCPFCGCTDIRFDDNGHEEWLKCDWCGATGGFDPAPEYESMSLEWHWNRRHLSATVPAEGEVEDLIEQLLDAQQDINLAANERMDQSLCDASALIDKTEALLRRLAASRLSQGAGVMDDQVQRLTEENEALRAYRDKFMAIAQDKLADTRLVNAGARGDGFGFDLSGGPIPYITEYLFQFIGAREPSGPSNYAEIEVQHNEFGAMTLTLQRRSGKTPHQLRQTAEARIKALEEALRPFAEYAWSLRGFPESQIELGWLGQNDAGEPVEVNLCVSTFQTARSALQGDTV